MRKALIDLHTHTISSGHAYSTLKENIEGAIERGLEFYGMSDHAPTIPGGAHAFHFNNLKVINREIMGIKVLRGVEVNIIDHNGNLDLEEGVLKSLDYVIASLHPPCIAYGSIEENTNAVIEAMKKPYVKIIGHPDDSRYPLDYEKVVLAAKEHNVLLEVNNSSLRPNANRVGANENARKMLGLCKEHNVTVVFGSDAHIYYDVGNFENCVKLACEIGFPYDLIFNYNKDKIEELFKLSDV